MMFRYFLIASVLFFVPLDTRAQTDVLFVIDSSGSMKQLLDGKSQMDAAKEALVSALSEIPQGTLVGIRAYAHRIPQSDKAESCKDSELIVPLAEVSKETVSAKVSSLTPKGYTPIAYSLEQTPNDFKSARESEKVIILLSDGEETCGGDPVAVLNRLKGEGFKVVVHTIGFNVDEKTKAQLREIAKTGDGEYFDAHNARALNLALKDATKRSFVIDKKKSTYGSEIRGGDSFETAVPIQLGVEYRLDHHQKRAFYDYFSVQAKRGQEIEVTLKTLEKGISIAQQERETDHPYAGVKVTAPSRNEIGKREIIGKKFGTEKVQAQVSEDGPHYILLGSEYEDMNKDSVTFMVNLSAKGDADSDSDAGDTSDGAIAIEAKRYQKSHLGGEDKKDLYKFDAKAGEKYFVGVIPSDELTGFIQISVFDDYKQSLVTARSKEAGEGVKSEPFNITSDGTYLLEISIPYGNDKVAGYIFDLKKTAESAPQAQASPAVEQQSTPTN